MAPDKIPWKQPVMTTEELIAELEKHPGCIVFMCETDYRLVPVGSVEFIEYGIVDSHGYVWIKT
jgi:hypothetical protein